MSHVNALYHIVFATYQRQMTITNDCREDFYRFIWKIITEKKSKLIRIGGIPNHVHILLDLHPTVALSDMVREIKAKSSGWMRRDPRFPNFIGWGKEYFAATVGYTSRDAVIEYIKSQQTHHNIHDFSEELNCLLLSEGMTITEYDT